MKCPQRLQNLIAWMPQDSVLIDVGCDHGYLGIYALQQQKVSRVVAIDRNQKPLELARKHVQEAGFEEKMECICADGLHHVEIPESAVLVCAGMGGILIHDIIQKASINKLQGIIIQANRDAHVVRNYLASQGWGVVQSSVFATAKKDFLSWISLPQQGYIQETSWHWQDPYLIENPTREWKNMLLKRHMHIQRVQKRNEGISTSLLQEERQLRHHTFKESCR